MARGECRPAFVLRPLLLPELQVKEETRHMATVIILPLLLAMSMLGKSLIKRL